MEKKRQNSRRFYCVVAVESCHAHQQQQQQLKYLPFFTCLDCRRVWVLVLRRRNFSVCVEIFRKIILNGTARAQCFNGFSSFWKPHADLNPPPKKKKKGKKGNNNIIFMIIFLNGAHRADGDGWWLALLFWSRCWRPACSWPLESWPLKSPAISPVKTRAQQLLHSTWKQVSSSKSYFLWQLYNVQCLKFNKIFGAWKFEKTKFPISNGLMSYFSDVLPTCFLTGSGVLLGEEEEERRES